MSPVAKNVSAAAAGIGYALAYGLWTAIATGGGHGNFIWFWMFIAVEMFGLYFPIMAVLAVNLSGRTSKVLFGSFIGANVVASVVMIISWINETPLDPPSDFARALKANGIVSLAFCAILHFLPAVVFTIMLFTGIRGGSSNDDEIVHSIFQN